MSGDSAEWVLKTLSPARMTPYLAETAGDVDAAFRLYQWNLSVCAAFYSPLHWLEVALRNAMHETLRDHFGSERWWEVVSLDRNGQAKIQETEAKLKKRLDLQGRATSADDIVAALTFGFWVSLVSRGGGYDRKLWVPALHRAFPSFSDRRRKLHDELDPVRHFRNRIMHYEPIFNRRLLGYHNGIYRLLGYLSTTLKVETRRFDRVPQVLAERPDLGSAR
ncbi:hypothetical protein [Saccharopolyspora elongata]|uniref:Abi-like protein n=1 Tax=Saccharopolyspora elongata TaxID=2530387 RepID=A0A4R4ZFH8_9PSEU|nr:hypothetical protein [Saccharopolyspora elongata]TDD56780.1 hypothetical protein E1288_01575 [Saccharopolyspora elongata]